ncbi:MAG: hypothetical protein PHN84_13365 [Desulfuromonadaceae bacterium]|nr:hypothetical protein [Desulfuromonadaceae bacterium]MDD2855580.1 hypothetical protein [Desulfuromonadaceae bacterium]
MLTETTIDFRRLELMNTVSDLMVGLECLDNAEVERVAKTLRELANEYSAFGLGKIAHDIQVAAETGDLDTAFSMIPDLQNSLTQTSNYLRHLSKVLGSTPSLPSNYTSISQKV